MKLPVAIVGVTVIVVLVAVPAFVAFLVTKANAEDSIDIVSRRLADATMTTVENEIRIKLQQEPEDELRSAKSDIEYGVAGLQNPENEVFWGKRGTHWLLNTGLFSLYVAIGGTQELGDIHGHGNGVNTASRSVSVNGPPFISLKRLDLVTREWSPTAFARIPVNLPTRPYVTVFTEGDNHRQYLRDNLPRWTDIIVGVNTELPGGGGLFGVVSIPVFQNTTADPDSFIGIIGLGIYLTLFELQPYLLSNSSSLLITDSKRQLISSTDMTEMFYVNGTTATGADNFEMYFLNGTNITLLSNLDSHLPSDIGDHEDGYTYFSKMTADNGDTYWVTMRVIEHYNLKWNLFMLTPERTFFQKIYDSNEETLITVIIMIVAATVVATIVTLLFTMDLKRLAKAFDRVSEMQMEHPDVERVRKSHILQEFNSLCRGFWQAVDTVKQVQAFLPDVGDDSDSETEDEPTVKSNDKTSRANGQDPNTAQSVTASRRSFSAVGKGGKDAVAAAFQLGVTTVNNATCLVINLPDFMKRCQANPVGAVKTHGDMFCVFADILKRHKGAISSVEGNRVVASWNTIKSCPSASSKVHAVSCALEIITETAGRVPMTFGINFGQTFYGIIGTKVQRFNVLGSDLVNVAVQLSEYCVRLDITPGILVSKSMVEYLKGFVVYQIDTNFTLPSGLALTALWVEKCLEVAEDEWMYQLEQEEAEKDTFLDKYFAALDAKDTSAARTALETFAAKRPDFATLVSKLQSDLVLRNHPHKF
ncbi:hypothetical protein DIPPA_13792 [Diplonema papillatum]|nr:hypothetical protein DIPPA_13792 [Diplonema papillatum]